MPRAKKKVTIYSGDNYRPSDLPEDRRKQYELIMEDFDKQVQEHIEQKEIELKTMQNMIRNTARMSLLGISRKFRQEIFESQEEKGPRLSEELAQVKASLESKVAITVESARLPQAMPTPVQMGPPMACSTAKRTSRKKTSSIKGVTGSHECPESILRRSGRSRATKSSDVTSKTPSTTSRVQRSAPLATPKVNGAPLHQNFITPKFNMTKPVSKTVMRIAKPCETLVSLSGSPVYVGPQTAAKTTKKKNASSMVSVPIGEGRTLMLPGGSPRAGGCGGYAPDVDLDDDAKRRLMALRTQLDNMLQNQKS